MLDALKADIAVIQPHDHETKPTDYFHWKGQRAYHIDHCFIPEAWAKNLRQVEIGEYEEWKEHSDHRPFLVELAQNTAHPLY